MKFSISDIYYVCGAGTVYPSGAHELTFGFSTVGVA